MSDDEVRAAAERLLNEAAFRDGEPDDVDSLLRFEQDILTVARAALEAGRSSGGPIREKKEWRLGWTSTEYVSGRWAEMTEIREYDPDSDLSDLVCVVETARAKRIMDGQAALEAGQETARLRAAFQAIRSHRNRMHIKPYLKTNDVHHLLHIIDAALSTPGEPESGQPTCDACGRKIAEDYLETLVEGEASTYHVACTPPGMPRRTVLVD